MFTVRLWSLENSVFMPIHFYPCFKETCFVLETTLSKLVTGKVFFLGLAISTVPILSLLKAGH